MYPNNNCNDCNDCPPICIIFTVDAEAVGGSPSPYASNCATEQAGIYNNKPYYQLYGEGCTQLVSAFVWWNIITNRWEFTLALGSGQVFCYNMNPGLYPISNSGFNWIEDEPELIMVSSLEGPCPGPLPLPDLSGLCGDEYDAACVIYTGPDIDCLGIESGMTFLEILVIFNNILPGCDCCEKVPVNCVVGPWGPWSQCECYYEDELLVCGRETRTRSVITFPENGGTACPPLVEYRPCDLPDVCFTFGSEFCDTQPDPQQFLLSPTGLLNGKPYYKLDFDCEGFSDDFYVWYNDNTDLWSFTPELGIPVPGTQTLNNGGNYLPISNETTQKWSSCESCGNYLVQSQTSTCPEVKMCFQYTILISSLAQAFTYYAYVAPAQLGDLSFPYYIWDINTPDGQYQITVQHENSGGWTMFYQTGFNDPVQGGTLDTDTFNPISTSVIQWETFEASSVQMQVSTLGGPCVQPPDVPCVLNCPDWSLSPCIGGTRTRTCTLVTPPSGNVPPCPPLIQTEPCAVPNCFPPTAVVATQTGSAVVISFTGVSGAASYQVSYSIDGGTPVLLSGASSPITLPYTCDATYTGTIVTQCTNGLTSSPVSWGPINTDACAFCNGEVARPMLGGGGLISPAGQTVPLTGSGDTTFALPNLNFGSGNVIYDINITPLGYVYSGDFTSVSSTAFTGVSGLNNIVLINCNFTPNAAFFGAGFSSSTFPQASVRKVVYDPNTNRLYVGGSFNRYKGVPCTPGFVVLNATTGNIDTSFAASAVGADNSLGQFEVTTIAIQPDGKILAGGVFTSMYGNNACKYLCRFTSAGVIDNSLVLGTSFTYTTQSLTIVSSLLLSPTGDIFVGGTFTAYQGTARNIIVKLSPTGALITAFNAGAVTNPSTGLAIVRDITYQGTQLLIGGGFSTFNGAGTPGGFARISDVTAAVDGSFTLYSPVGVTTEVHKILVKNNKIYLGCSYSQYGSSNKGKYYILNSNGTINTSTTVNITGGSSGSAIHAILILP